MLIYIQILIVAIIFSVNPILKKNLLQDFSKDEVQIYSGILNLILFSLIKFFTTRKIEFREITSHKKLNYFLLILSSFLIVTYSYLLNVMLSDNSPDFVMTNIKCLETIILFLYGIFIFKTEINFNKILGVIFILAGLYLSK